MMIGATVGCHRTAVIERPEVDEARTVLFIGERDGAPQFIFALNNTGFEPVASRNGDVWWTIAYDCSPGTLGLDQGVVLLNPASDAVEVPRLPSPSSMQRLVPNEGGAWETVTEVSPAVADALLRLPLPEDNRCRMIEPEFEVAGFTLELPNQAIYYATFAAEEDFGEVLVAALEFKNVSQTSTSGSSLFTVDTFTGEVTVVDEGPGPYLGGYRDSGGEYWFVTTDGILRGRVDEGFTQVMAFDGIQPVRWATVAGRGAGDDVELSIFVTDADGSTLNATRTWLYFTPGRLDVLGTRTRGTHIGVSAFVGAAHIIALNALDQGTDAFEWVNGEVRRHAAPDGKAFVELAEHPLLGVLLRSEVDSIFTLSDGIFSLVATDVATITGSFPSLFGPLWIGSSTSQSRGAPGGLKPRIVQHVDGIGTCDYQPFGSSSDLQRIAHSSDRNTVFTIEAAYMPRQLRATRITYQESVPSCALR